MADITQLSAWVLKLADFLVGKHGYTMVTLNESQQELWLVNQKNRYTPMIMLTSLPVQDIDKEKAEALKQTLAVMFKVKQEYLVISVNKNSQTSEKEVYVGPKEKSQSLFLNQFPGIEYVLNDTENPETVFHQASASLRRAIVKNNRNQRKLHRNPVAMTFSIIAIAMSWIFMMVTLLDTDFATMMLVGGAYYKPLIVGGYEVWRLFTAVFVQTDILTLIFTLILFNNIAQILEPAYRWKKMLLLLLGGIFSGLLFVFITEDAQLVWGLGAPIYAMMGALVVHVIETKMYKSTVITAQLSSIAFMGIVMMILPGNSVSVTVGSAMFGMFFGILGSKRKDWDSIRKMLRIAVPVFYVFITYVATTRMQPMIDAKVVSNYIDAWKQIGFEPYVTHLINTLQ